MIENLDDLADAIRDASGGESNVPQLLRRIAQYNRLVDLGAPDLILGRQEAMILSSLGVLMGLNYEDTRDICLRNTAQMDAAVGLDPSDTDPNELAEIDAELDALCDEDDPPPEDVVGNVLQFPSRSF